MIETQLSIIMPVFNADKYLNRCIESILAQSYKDFELIIINDGSVDNTKNICEYYSTKDERIKVITKINAGQSAARNDGLKIAKGEYIQFVDADDWLEPCACENLIDNLKDNDVDLVMASYSFINKKNTSKLKFVDEVYEIQDFIPKLYKYFESWAFNVLWNKIYKAEIIKGNKIIFDEKLNYSEDLIFNLKYLSKVRSLKISSCNVYNYNKINEGSSTKKNISIMYDIQFDAYKTISEIFELNNWDNELNKKWLEISYVDMIYSYLRSMNLYNIYRYKNTLKRIFNDKKCIDIMKNQKNVSIYIKLINKSFLSKKIIICISVLKLYPVIHFIFAIKKKLRV